MLGPAGSLDDVVVLSRRAFLTRSLSGGGALILLVACGRGDEDVTVIANGTALTGTPAPSETGTAVPALSVTPDSTFDPDAITGFVLPIAGACLPDSDNLMPNAPRPYRNGVHEGVDFYPFNSCAVIESGTPIVAMAAGTVIRADLDYVDITAEQVEELDAQTNAQGYSDPETLDTYRGRQVWIDHGDGIVTRYCHLSAIAEGIERGVAVEQGAYIAGVGESGTPESVTAPGTEMHLHAEVRVGESFLGADLPAGDVRRLYNQLFSLADSPAPAEEPVEEPPPEETPAEEAPVEDTPEEAG